MRKEIEYISKIEDNLSVIKDIWIELGTPLPSMTSSFIYRPDIVVAKGDNRLFLEVKIGEVTGRDIIELSGRAKDTGCTLGIITNKRIKEETKKFAKDLSVNLFVGEPDKVAQDIKTYIKIPKEKE